MTTLIRYVPAASFVAAMHWASGKIQHHAFRLQRYRRDTQDYE